MRRPRILLLLGACASRLLAQTHFELNAQSLARAVPPPGIAQADPERGMVYHLRVAPGDPEPHAAQIPLPIEPLRGTRVWIGADVRAENLSPKPNPWNGVKVMLVIQTPTGTSYPQPEIPSGSFPWQRFSLNNAMIPHDATSAHLVLGLEQVTGSVWFDQVRITRRPQLAPAPPADPQQPIYRGHNLPRLRGAMAGTRLTRADIQYFAQTLKGNLFRWQLFEAAQRNRPLDEYDVWINQELDYLDQVIEYCRDYGVKLAIDLHSPPGGEAFAAGYITARGDIFRKPEAQAKFIEVWRRIARRYKGNPVIWGYDLLNEPDDSMQSEEAMDWQSLALATARAIRDIDPDITLIISPNGWGSPAAFDGFQPLDINNCVYTFHLYAPHAFTHQGIHGNPAGIHYPGEIAGQPWDQSALERHMQPAIAFANRYRVHMYVGEFSAIRIAPEGSAARWLADAIDLFEQHGFDWSYHAYREWHGWSVEHEGTLSEPRLAASPTDRQQVLTRWFQLNQRPTFAR